MYVLPVTKWVAVFSLMMVATGQRPSAGTNVSQLGNLTPIGAERAGNADGTIPAWTGGLPKADPIDPKVGYVDPYAGEQPSFTITAANADKYKEYLSAGHLALLKRDARTFKMNVYPTHRTAAYPEDVLAEVQKHAGQAATNGNHINNVGQTTVPFPVPADGLQVMWNHVFRWHGGSFERQYIWAPVAASGSFYIVKSRLNVAFDQQGYMDVHRPDRLYNSNEYFLSPPSALGIRQVEWEPIDPAATPRVRWIHIAQTLADRRLPAYDHDELQLYTAGMVTADQVDGWNGEPDRYDWKLLGKREMMIGYNAYKLMDRNLRYGDIIRARNLNPDLLRYERHRVWVVEATLKKGKNHVYYRRIFYVDEDTWQVAMEEIYNRKGVLTNFGDYHMVQFYDVLVPWYAAMVNHIIRSGSYLVTDLANQEEFPMRWGFKGRMDDYLPSHLRSLGLP